MPLPPDLDKKIRETIDEIWEDAQRMTSTDDTRYYLVKTRLQTLLQYLSRDEKSFSSLVLEMDKWMPHYYSPLLGYVKAIKRDYEQGLFDSLSETIQTNVNVDYMHIAEQVFQDNTTGNPIDSYVPAGILAGAVLENALRTLCQRKNIDIFKPNSKDYKALNALIDDLQKASFFNTAQADFLRGCAKIRNDLAHGHFGNVTRGEVAKMINEVKDFIAKYL